MSNDKESMLSIPHFDGDYEHWEMLMENLLRSKEWWPLVETGFTEPARGEVLTGAQRTQLADLKLKDLKVKNYLFQAIDKTTLKTITHKETAKQIWDSMKTRFQGDERVRNAQLQTLRRDFEVIEMKNDESITDYFSRVVLLSNDMANLGETLEDGKIVEKILRTLPETWNYVVCSIEESKDIRSLSVNQLRSSLLVHEQKFRRRQSSEDQVLKATVEQKREQGSRGRGQSYNRGRGRGRYTSNRATMECFKCGKLGHFKSACPTWNTEAYYAEYDDEEEEMLLMAFIEQHQATRGDAWFLDSGCSNHMCGDKSKFSELNEDFSRRVKLGNNTRMNVLGKGTIRLCLEGVVHKVQNVYYVPELQHNLLSIGQLQERGLTILIKDGMCRIYHPLKGLIIQTDMTTNRMFVLFSKEACYNEEDKRETCLQITSHSDLNPEYLWHCRFAHLSYKGLLTLQSKNMVKGLPSIALAKQVCESCLKGKQHRDAIPKKSKWRASHKLQLIHADLCGPITPSSNNEKRYILCLIDDFSRKAWSYFLLEKSDAFIHFKRFKMMIEKESGFAIKCLRTYRGGEFCSHEFSEFCKTHGIKRQLTTPYTPQHNGVAERKNRTILNLVRSTLLEKKIPKTFWPEAVQWVTYILNRSPTTALSDKTPEEAWSGRKPEVGHFKIFGCIGHVHIPDATRTKLEDKSIKCVMLGFSEESKGYKMYNPETRRVKISKDVVFEENKQWDWSSSHRQQVEMELQWDDEEGSNGADNEVEDREGEANIGGADAGIEEVDREDDATERREHRVRTRPAWLSDYVSGEGLSEEEDAVGTEEDVVVNMIVTDITDPTTYEEAVQHDKWRKAMETEIKAIEKNKTWTLTDLPAGAKKIGVKWIFKTKLNGDGQVDKFKARLVAKGYSQQYGIDYTEVFAPVARMDTVRLILAQAAQNRWKVFQLDVKSAFLHGTLEEDVYVEQPKGFESSDKEKVYKLHKALYGLKQAPRAWFSRIKTYFLAQGFHKSQHEHTLFVKKEGTKLIIVSIYVDDLIYTGNDEKMLSAFKESMQKEFDMTDLGSMCYFLGIEVVQSDCGIFICQKKYIAEVLKRFGMEECNAVRNPMVPGQKLFQDDEEGVDDKEFKQIVGSLMYITATRPDLMFVVSLIARFMSKPTEKHMLAAKRCLRYLKGTMSYGIWYKNGGTEELVGFTDSDYAGDLDGGKSTSGYVFFINNSAVAWSSKKQPIVTLSTTEAEFVAAAGCACQAIWMRRILDEIGYSRQESITILCDNSSAIKLSKNAVMHGRSKHIHVRYFFLRDLNEEGTINLQYCGTRDQVADMFTKALGLSVFESFRAQLGVCEASSVN